MTRALDHANSISGLARHVTESKKMENVKLAESAAWSPAQAGGHLNLSVLIVDDEAMIRRIISRQLSQTGCVCETASGAEEALAILRTQPFNVVLTDLFMPGVDGISFLRQLEQENLDTVAVVLSGRVETSKVVEAMRCGAFDCVEKSASFQTLLNAVVRAGEHQRLKRRAREMGELAYQWQATFDAVPEMIAIVDQEHKLVRVNRAMAERLGEQADAARGRFCYDYMHGVSCPIAGCPHSLTLHDEREHTAKIHDPHLGGTFFVTTAPLRNAQGRVVGSVHVARDITAQEEAEERLRKAHGETENLLASMSSFLIGMDERGHITRWNSKAETLFGIPADQAHGKPFQSLPICWDWKYIEKHMVQWLRAGHPIRLPEMRYTGPEGNGGYLDITVNPLRSGSDAVAGIFLLGTDITERKNLESQLVHAQKLESIGQLAAGIAHEINTPTQFVGDNMRFLQTAFEDRQRLFEHFLELERRAREYGYLSEVVTEIETTCREIDVDYLNEEIPKAIQESLNGLDRVARIVRAMKEFSHPDTSAEKTPVDLNRAIESTITVARNEWKYVADMETDFDPELPLVSCLPGEFNQVILNMIINAAHAIAEKVGDGSHEKGLIRVTTTRKGSMAEIRITDTGTGIPERVRAKVFDPFFTTKEVGKGTGQGLAIAYNVVVEKHNGTIDIETEVGKGSTFIVRLPINGVE